MKLITWKELISLKGDVVWSCYDEDNLSIGEKVYIFFMI